jgi:hypothetical protein
MAGSRQWAASLSGLVADDLPRIRSLGTAVIRLFLYLGSAAIVSAAVLVLGLVLLSDIAGLGKLSVLILCLAGGAFSAFAIAAHRAEHASGRRKHWRRAILCWCLAAAALAVLVASALMGLL